MTETTTEHAAPRMQRRDQSSTVTVACNHPNGIKLVVYDIEVVESSLPNGRTIKEHSATIDEGAGSFVLNGPSLDLAAVAAGALPDFRIIKSKTPGTGYGLTTGIPRAFWERWLEQNKNSPLVKNKVVFAAASEERAASEAKELAEMRSGFQGLNQAGDYRVPSGRQIRKYSPSDNRTSPEQPELTTAE